MGPLDMDQKFSPARRSHAAADQLRSKLVEHSKDFKTSWVKLGQALYPVWKDKLFYGWGYDKFEYYTERELGIKKPTAIKLLKSYFFLEQQEPHYLTEKFSEEREAPQVPGWDAVNVLRMAKQKKELTEEDYRHLRESVFEKGRDAAGVRKDLTTMMKEREEVDPDEERRMRNLAALRRMHNAIRSFKRDIETLKLVPAALIQETEKLLKQIEAQIKENE